ncbi:MAG: DNA-3-methyladenine glycosylase [Phycisphaera sp.]|nr:DNA-3-methyladenine glycosylase [Phycisphaera sp.]
MNLRLPRGFYRRDPVTVARGLLGQQLVRVFKGQRLAGIIVETEAYLGVIDRAAHTFNGRRTPRNEAMYADGGTAYVYFTYGLHHCFNVVCGKINNPLAVLVRALEPVEGIDVMKRHRRAAKRRTDLCSGPAKLCEALAIDRSFNTTDMVESKTLFIEQTRARSLPAKSITVTPRIGIGYAREWADKPLRFVIINHPHASRPPVKHP